MRVVIDTNVLISALLVETSAAAQLLALFRRKKFKVVSSFDQMDELKNVMRYPKIRNRLKKGLAGRFVNELKEMVEMVDPFPVQGISPDPYDDYLLGISVAASADYLITGDKAHLLVLKKFKGTRILSIKQFFKTTGLLF